MTGHPHLVKKAHHTSADQAALYSEYLAAHSKEYYSVEEWHRRAQIFSENDRLIREWNRQDKGTVLAHNKFSDWEDHEYLGLLKH